MIKCQICNRECKDFRGLSVHLWRMHKNITLEDYYKKFLKQENEGICKMYGILPSCKKYTSFRSLSQGYLDHCSVECATNNPSVKEKCRQTCLDKYGVVCSLQSEDINEKARQTCLEKYGVEYSAQSEKIRCKNKQTNLDRYGVEHPIQAEKIKEKIKQTCLERYGVEYTFQSVVIRGKAKQTLLNRYGVENSSQLEDVQEKRKQTCLEKYGVENSTQSKEVQKKIKQTNLERYGVGNLLHSKQAREKSKQTKKINQELKIREHLEFLDLKLLDEFVSVNRRRVKLLCKKCGLVFETVLGYLNQGYGFCPVCFPKYRSRLEQKLFNFIQEVLPDIKTIKNSRQIIPPFELDIYIPEKKLAIEFNGLYWHSDDRGKDRNYHLNKTLACEKQGIRLIHVFEDEWLFKQDIVKSRLRQILGVGDSKRIHARKCVIREITPKEKNKFLEKYHIQGKDSSSIKLGAFHENQLISVMTFSKPSIAKGQRKRIEGVWELNRFCSHTDFHIPGIAGKLLKYFERNYSWREIYSYADRRWSDGDLYYKLGFDFVSETKSNYWYVSGPKRIHRFGLRKRADESEDIPEWILRQKEGYSRVWDCGNLKFKKLNE